MSEEKVVLGPNSNRFKEQTKEAPKVSKVVSGNVKIEKRGFSDKVRETFIQEDMAVVKNYILWDVLVPRIKDAVYNILNDTLGGSLDMIFYGKDKTGRPSYRSSINRNNPERYSNISYRSTSSQVNRYNQQTPEPDDKVDYQNIILETRGEAEKVIDTLLEAIDVYGEVSIGDLYDALGKTTDFTYRKHGWYDLRDAKVRYYHGGWLLDLPKAVPLMR